MGHVKQISALWEYGCYNWAFHSFFTPKLQLLKIKGTTIKSPGGGGGGGIKVFVADNLFISTRSN